MLLEKNCSPQNLMSILQIATEFIYVLPSNLQSQREKEMKSSIEYFITISMKGNAKTLNFSKNNEKFDLFLHTSGFNKNDSILRSKLTK